MSESRDFMQTLEEAIVHMDAGGSLEGVDTGIVIHVTKAGIRVDHSGLSHSKMLSILRIVLDDN